MVQIDGGTSMAINKLMLKALSALSSHDVDVKKNYKLDRAINELIHPPIIRPFRVWDEEPTICGRKIPVRIFLPEKERGRGISLFVFVGIDQQKAVGNAGLL